MVEVENLALRSERASLSFPFVHQPPGPMSRLPPLGVPLPPPPEDPEEFGNSLGKRGEALVAKDLEQRGWPSIERNAKHSGVELDLVAQDRHHCLIVEVKSSRALHPECNLQPKQMERLFRAARTLGGKGKQALLLLGTIRFVQNRAVELCYFRIQAE
ncbi:MAG TPA: hypothetical protein ENK02_01005 [Planctomycetes bacterium]|nr:hypothetical protein [Planctomycetota bacterium]